MIFEEKKYVKEYAKTWFPMWQEYEFKQDIAFFQIFLGFF